MLLVDGPLELDDWYQQCTGVCQCKLIAKNGGNLGAEHNSSSLQYNDPHNCQVDDDINTVFWSPQWWVIEEKISRPFEKKNSFSLYLMYVLLFYKDNTLVAAETMVLQGQLNPVAESMVL